jgi:hypothetical protein
VVAVAGAATAAALSLGGGDTPTRTAAQPPPRTDTVTRTVTTTTAEAPSAPRVEARSPSQLNDAGYRQLRAGDASGALPLLERAVSGLAGTGSTAEAYASYNLAWARFSVGRCDGVLELLDRSQQVQGRRKEIDRLRKEVAHRCEGHGRGNGQDEG